MDQPRLTNEQMREAFLNGDIKADTGAPEFVTTCDPGWKLTNGHTKCTVMLTIGDQVFILDGMSEEDAHRMWLVTCGTPGVDLGVERQG